MYVLLCVFEFFAFLDHRFNFFRILQSGGNKNITWYNRSTSIMILPS